jgi:hypothetical protein
MRLRGRNPSSTFRSCLNQSNPFLSVWTDTPLSTGCDYRVEAGFFVALSTEEKTPGPCEPGAN